MLYCGLNTKLIISKTSEQAKFLGKFKLLGLSWRYEFVGVLFTARYQVPHSLAFLM
jgi:hypothetical protein